MKTINYELAKKLYDAGVVIENENSWYKMSFLDEPFVAQNNLYTENFEHKFPAPYIEEVIEFLKFSITTIAYALDNYYVGITQYDLGFFEKPTLLEALEATLEYLLDNGYIGDKNF